MRNLRKSDKTTPLIHKLWKICNFIQKNRHFNFKLKKHTRTLTTMQKQPTNKKHCHRNNSPGEKIFSALGPSYCQRFIYWSADVEKLNRNWRKDAWKEWQNECHVLSLHVDTISQILLTTSLTELNIGNTGQNTQPEIDSYYMYFY